MDRAAGTKQNARRRKSADGTRSTMQSLDEVPTQQRKGSVPQPSRAIPATTPTQTPLKNANNTKNATAMLAPAPPPPKPSPTTALKPNVPPVPPKTPIAPKTPQPAPSSMNPFPQKQNPTLMALLPPVPPRANSPKKQPVPPPAPPPPRPPVPHPPAPHPPAPPPQQPTMKPPIKNAATATHMPVAQLPAITAPAPPCPTPPPQPFIASAEVLKKGEKSKGTVDEGESSEKKSTKDRRFICAQAPLNGTIEEFWKMIISSGVEYIVMLCEFEEQGKSKSAVYFPVKTGATLKVGKQYTVTKLSSENLDKTLTMSTLSIVKKDKSDAAAITVKHIHWHHWPDHGVPDTLIAPLHVLRELKGCKTPIVVHCSAGVGRTGTLVLIFIILESLRLPEFSGVPPLLAKLREQRFKSIQTEIQYLYVHRCVLDYFYHKNYLFSHEHYETFVKEYKVVEKTPSIFPVQIPFFNKLDLV
uniref:Protein-tyrosine phosphatase n=1 Tax=Caenorhabditis tropicalis TaxID=1561998 RepID=A0A1I7ULB3_9PELO